MKGTGKEQNSRNPAFFGDRNAVQAIGMLNKKRDRTSAQSLLHTMDASAKEERLKLFPLKGCVDGLRQQAEIRYQ